MSRKQTRPPGLWKSPLQATDLAGQLRFSDVAWDGSGKSLIWREERSDRGILVGSKVGSDSTTDLTTDLSVRARVGYGGGDFTVSPRGICFAAEGRLFWQAFPDTSATPITPGWGQSTSPVVSPDGENVLYVHSAEGTDVLGMVDVEGGMWPSKLAAGHDFFMQPCWHPDGDRIAWIAWDHPNMPWDGTALYMGTLGSGNQLPGLSEVSLVAGNVKGKEAIFQPMFSPDGRYLSYMSNRNGWFNLYLRDIHSQGEQLLVEEEAEQAPAAWIHGLRSYAWTFDSNAIYYLRVSRGFTSLVRYDLGDKTSEVVQGELQNYTSLKQIAVSPKQERIALLASAPTTPESVIAVSRSGEVQVYRRSSEESAHPAYLSQPKSLSWSVPTSFTIDYCHGLYYPPANPDFDIAEAPPAIIKIHGGPTSQFEANYHGDTQFFTSRGYAVLELNYRGSSGYGKAYMDALRGNWGRFDVEDTRAAADYLSSEGLADPEKLILMGGSAGGYTVLLCLIAYPGFFRAAVCRYAVANLFTLADQTHKFEARYLDSLIGVLPQDEERYRERSPVYAADKIVDPIAIFQGEDDQVVPKAQADEIVASLAQRGVPYLYRLFSGEGHGWRKRETIETYYETVEEFLADQLTTDSS